MQKIIRSKFDICNIPCYNMLRFFKEDSDCINYPPLKPEGLKCGPEAEPG